MEYITEELRGLAKRADMQDGECVLLDDAANEIDRLTALVEQQWQPIETAPKDGTEILARGEHLSVSVVRYEEHHSCWAYTMGCGSDDHAVFYAFMRVTPTHWMPLPPTQQEGE